MAYNITLILEAEGLNKLCEMSIVSNYFWSYGILIIILIVSTYIALKRGYTIYTTLPVTFFITACISTLMWLWTCSGNMLPGKIVVILWMCTVTFTVIRKLVGE